MINSLENEFNLLSNKIKNTNINIDNKLKLELYKYYKQSTIGDCTINQPSMINIIKYNKWKEWNSIKKMNKNEAMSNYINIVKNILDK